MVGIPGRHIVLETLPSSFDVAAQRTPDVSTFCSGRDWCISAATALHHTTEPLIWQDGDHWLALGRSYHDQVGAYLQPLEADWGFASPLLGPDTRICIEMLVQCLNRPEPLWNVALLSGLSPSAAHSVNRALSGTYRCMLREGISCQLTDLSGGFDSFLARRSPKMRANLLRGMRKLGTNGMVVDHVDAHGSVEDLLNRVLSVEQHSWKRAAGQSVLLSPRYHAFYQAVLERAAIRGGLRAAFITRDGVDVAYIFGAVLGDTYRGFQLGFHEEYARFGLGNQAQLAMIKRLSEEGIRWYDLGMSMEYKYRWSDRLLDLNTVVVIRHN